MYGYRRREQEPVQSKLLAKHQMNFKKKEHGHVSCYQSARDEDKKNKNNNNSDTRTYDNKRCHTYGEGFSSLETAELNPCYVRTYFLKRSDQPKQM